MKACHGLWPWRSFIGWGMVLVAMLLWALIRRWRTPLENLETTTEWAPAAASEEEK